MARSVPAGAGDELRTRQRKTPLAEALDQQRINRLAHFDVPAHKSGRGNLELTEYLGARAMAMDVNSMKPLDGPCLQVPPRMSAGVAALRRRE